MHKGVCRRSREVVVLKSYTLSAICELYQHQIFREVRLHSSLQHENVVKLYAAFKVGLGGRLAGWEAGLGAGGERGKMRRAPQGRPGVGAARTHKAAEIGKGRALPNERRGSPRALPSPPAVP